MKNRHLKRKILDISFKHGLSHLGSCLGSVDTIKQIYDIKGENDKVVLSAGHCGVALYVVIEDSTGYSAERMLLDGGVHPDSLSQPVDCSSGSLGHGLGIAIGMAISNPENIIHVVTTDGELSEGSMWEALEVISRRGIKNIRLYVLLNGTSAYQYTDVKRLEKRLMEYEDIGNVEKDVIGIDKEYHTWIFPVKVNVMEEFPILKGMDSHYKVLNEEEYNYLKELTNETI